MNDNPQSPRSWGIAILSISLLWLLEWLLPKGAIDPWGLIHPQKIIHLVKILAVIQLLGMALMGFLGAKAGLAMSGFLGGLISSTMTTASLSQRSKTLELKEDRVHSVAFLTAILAMIFQSALILVTGLENPSFKVLGVLLGPTVATIILIAIRVHRTYDVQVSPEPPAPVSMISLIKLALFIMVVLAISRGLQNLLGDSGPILTTMIASLFEMHATLMANIELSENEHISTFLLMSLLAISFCSTCFSKLFLVYSLASEYMRKKFIIWTILLLVIQLLNWLLFKFIYTY